MHEILGEGAVSAEAIIYCVSLYAQLNPQYSLFDYLALQFGKVHRGIWRGTVGCTESAEKTDFTLLLLIYGPTHINGPKCRKCTGIESIALTFRCFNTY